MELNIHHDWRNVRDPLGVLSVSDSEMTSLEAPGVNFFSDKRPEVHTEFERKFGRQMKNEDVTKQVLQKGAVKRTDFEDKYGIGPLTTEEIDLFLKHQNNGNDRLDSNILASKSKNCKRSIPAHEILGRSLATDLALSISKMLAKYSLYTLSHITLVFPGDSICSAMLHSPNIEIKNTLLLGGVRKAEANLRIITEVLKNTSIWLTWLPGESNPSDLSSKLVLDPIPAINSDFYRKGPQQFHSKKQIKEFCYKNFTPQGNWQWFGLPDKLTKVNENASKLRDLLNTTVSDPLRTEETKQFIKTKEDEYIQCKLCSLEEIDDSIYKCMECVETQNPADNCSILMLTRSKVKKDIAQEVESTSHEMIHKGTCTNKKELVRATKKQAHEAELPSSPDKKASVSTETIPDKSTIPKCSRAIESIISSNRLDNVSCLIPANYKYFLNKPIIEKSLYVSMLTKVCDWNVTFSLFHNFIKSVIAFKTQIKPYKGKIIDSFAETWRAIILSSQAHFVYKPTKKTSTTFENDMLVTDFRLNSVAHENLFSTRILPIINGNDPLAIKLIRNLYLSSCNYGQAHANNKDTEAQSMRGKFGVYITNAPKLIRELSYNCMVCNKYRERKTKVKMGDLSVRISNKPRPFQSISIDPQGAIDVKPWYGARTSITCYPLMIKCLQSSAINVKLMFKNDTGHVILKLLELESQFAVKIEHLSVDFGSNLFIKNLNPKGKHGKHLFDMLQSSYTALPQAQMQNCAESGVKIFKAYLKKVFQLTKDGKIKPMCPDEWSYLFTFICNQINDIPYVVDKNGYMLSPNDLVHFSPMSAIGNFDASTHFRNIEEFLENSKYHYKILQETMINTATDEWVRLQQQDHNKKSGLNVKIQEGTLVGWRNSDNKFQSGVVMKIQGNLSLLASIDYNDFIKSLGRGIKNK